ncbi:MAG: L,D-transpeptidase family protein [SAR324 cluster bacterium]|nr:L,D-transpeptidase family protein [SAR324 cluster bacterium]
MKKICFLGAMLLYSSTLLANSQPASLIAYEKPGATALLVDKSECSVNVYQFNQHWENIYKVDCDVGKVAGDKLKEGDLKTPTGFYQLSQAWTGKTLRKQYGASAKIYGAGAFALNYPNYLDKVLYRKTGYGIWLHGTDKPHPEATRGCIATSNEDLLELARFINLKATPFIVEEKIDFLPEIKIRKIRNELSDFVENWRKYWESDKTEKYLSLYSKKFKTQRFNYDQWKNYKRIVNRRNKNRKIELRDLVIFKVKGVYTVQFTQKYSSTRINSTGRKHLYVVRNQGKLRIVSEKFENLPQHQPISPLQFAYKENEKTVF